MVRFFPTCPHYHLIPICIEIVKTTDTHSKYYKTFTLKIHINPLPDDKFSKLKDFADDNLKFEENCRELFKPVENTVGKGEIAPTVFSKGLFPRGIKRCHCVGMGLAKEATSFQKTCKYVCVCVRVRVCVCVCVCVF